MSSDDEEYGFCGLEGVTAPTAPLFRSVEHLSGDVVPQTMPAVLRALDLMRRDRDELVEKLQGVQAETELVRGLLLTANASANGNAKELVHALKDRDYWQDKALELMGERDRLQCRVEELEES